MTKHYNYSEKKTGDQLSAEEWNSLAQDVDAAVTAINTGSVGGSSNSSLAVTTDTEDADKRIITIDGVFVGELTDKGDKGVNVNVSGNNNINIEPRPAAGTGEGKNTPGLADRKGGNISLKPGDDIELCSHKRGTGKNTEVAVKAIDGSDNPVKLQIFAGDITLTTKGKDATKVKGSDGEDIKTTYRTTKNYSGGKNLPVVLSGGNYYLAESNTKDAAASSTQVDAAYVTSSLLYDDPNVMNVNITDGENKGYLKVRAKAIDLRCEEHGGIALQPKGLDSNNHMNKIKFEHGGGDGMEFGTFNTEKASIYTNEVRFRNNAKWYSAERITENRTDYAPDGIRNPNSQNYNLTAAEGVWGVNNVPNAEECAAIYKKYDANDRTTWYFHIKQNDDFYDKKNDDFFVETESLVGTGFALNHIRQYTNNDNSVSGYKVSTGEDGFITVVAGTGVTSGNTTTWTWNSEPYAKCDIIDVVRLVNYMKTQQLGPWQTNLDTPYRSARSIELDDAGAQASSTVLTIRDSISTEEPIDAGGIDVGN